MTLSHIYPRTRTGFGLRGIRAGIKVGVILSVFVMPLVALMAVNKTPHLQYAIVIDDDIKWRTIIAEELQKLGFTVQSCPTFCDYPNASVIVVDAQDPAKIVVGPGFVQRLRLTHPRAFIIGISGALGFTQPGALATVQVQFMSAGANITLDKSSFDNREFRALIPKE